MAQQKATTSTAVIEAAAQVFREKGYRNATLDDIAQEAGISKPTVYRYAKSKQWLMDRIIKTVQAQLDERGEAVWDDTLTPLERLRRLIKINVETSVEFRPFYEVALSQHWESSPRAGRAYLQWARRVTANTQQLLQDAADQGLLDLPGDMMTYAQLLQGMLASIHRWYRADGPLSPDDVTDHVLQLLTAGQRDRVMTPA